MHFEAEFPIKLHHLACELRLMKFGTAKGKNLQLLAVRTTKDVDSTQLHEDHHSQQKRQKLETSTQHVESTLSSIISF